MAEMTTILQRADEAAGVAWLTFNRPEKKNAMSHKFMAELIGALKNLADNDKIKCVVTMGSGDSYSSGLDLYDLRHVPPDHPANLGVRRVTRRCHLPPP